MGAGLVLGAWAALRGLLVLVPRAGALAGRTGGHRAAVALFAGTVLLIRGWVLSPVDGAADTLAHWVAPGWFRVAADVLWPCGLILTLRRVLRPAARRA